MRVTFVNGPGLCGGSQQQLVELCQYMPARGWEAELADPATFPRDPPDIVHLSHLNSRWTWATYQYAKQYQRPLVIKSIFSQMSESVSDAQFHEIGTYASCIICESADERRRVLLKCSTAADKIVWMMPAVPDAFVSKTPIASRLYVHANGRYAAVKDFPSILQACRELDLPVIVCGIRQSHEVWDACVRLKYGKILGPQNREQLCEIYNQTRVYVCNSLTEQNSGSVNEAVACGCRVVSTTRHAANSEFPCEGYVVFAAGQLQEALSRVYHDPVMVQRNTWWSYDRLADSLGSVFSRVLQKPEVDCERSSDAGLPA